MISTNLIEAKDRIREERKRLGLRQEDAAEKCGLSRSMWIRYERGQSVLDGVALRAFGAIGADTAYILTGERDYHQQSDALHRKMNSGDTTLEEDNDLLNADVSIHAQQYIKFMSAIDFLTDNHNFADIAGDANRRFAIDVINEMANTKMQYRSQILLKLLRLDQQEFKLIERMLNGIGG